MASYATSAFPNTDPGYPSLPVVDLLTLVEELVARIRLCFGFGREDFERDVQPLLRAYASYVQMLPATADNYFSAPGGLLKLGLEVAFFALQGTDAHIFSGRATISERRQLEPRWRLATFVGGLCCELHRVLTHVVVTDAHDRRWPAYLTPLSAWLAERCSERYFVSWRPGAVESRGMGMFALPLVVPPSTLQFLDEDNMVIVPHLLASIGSTPLYRDANVLDSLVRRSLALVIDRHLQATGRHGAPPLGAHLERYVVDATRRLSSSHSSWVPNRERSRTWFAPDGLFLVWPQSAADVLALLEADQLPGMPKAPEPVLDLLLAAGVLASQDDGHAIWTILPPGAKAPLQAVKLSSPEILLADLDPRPQVLAKPIVCRAAAAKPADAAAPESPQAPPGTRYSLLEPAIPEDGTPTSPTVPAPPAFSLNAPLRLNPAVRDALAAIVHTLNGPGTEVAARTVAAGLFVPLPAFDRHGIQPAVAIRALADVSMLVLPERGRPPTVSQDFGGQAALGLVIAPQFVQGFDLAAFAPGAIAEP